MRHARESRASPPTFVKELESTGRPLVKKVSIVPLEVIVRNISAGSFAKHYGVEGGHRLRASPPSSSPIRTTTLGDPLLNTYHALALKLATREEIKT